MKLKEGMVIEQLGEEYVAVATMEASKTFNGMIRGNATFGFLMEQLTKECTEEELAEALLNKYDITKEKADEVVTDFIKKLSDAGVLE